MLNSRSFLTRRLIRVSIILSLTMNAFVLAHVAQGDLEQSIELMGKIGVTNFPNYSPDGKTIAFVSNVTGVPQIWTVPAGGGFPKLITSFNDPVGYLTWSPASNWLAFTVVPGGGLNEQIYVSRPDGSDLRRLTKGGEESNFLSGWTRDGKYVFVSSNLRERGSLDTYLVDVITGDMHLVAQNPGVAVISDVSRAGRRVIINRIKQGDNDLFLIDRVTKKETLLTPHEGPGSFESAQFAPDGNTIYFASNKDSDLRGLARVKLDLDGRPGRTELVAHRPDAELDEIQISDEGGIVILKWNYAGRSELGRFNVKSGRMTLGPKLPVEILGAFDLAADSKHLALVLSGPAAPPDIWTLDLKNNQLFQLTYSPHPGVKLGDLVRPDLVKYEAHDGLGLSGWLYLPRGAREKLPFVLSFHGGPEVQERPSFNSTYQALLRRGIAIFAPNVRGSAGFGKRFASLDNGRLRRDAISDIKSSVLHLVNTGLADSKRIGIMGSSYGGYMVMAGLTEFPELFAAGTSLYGISNFETFFKNTQPWMAEISRDEYGSPETQLDLLRELSPINRIDRVRSPVLVIHGANDTNVPVIEAQQIVQNLKRRGVSVDFILFPDEGHGWRKSSNRIRSTVSIVNFFTKFLSDG